VNIIFEDKLTLDEYLEGHQVIHGQERPRKETGQAIFGVVILAFIIWQFSMPAAIAVFVILAGLISFPTVKRKRDTKRFMQAQEDTPNSGVELKEDGVLISGQSHTSFFEWTAFKKHYKGKKILILFNEAGINFSIPYRVFPDETEKDRFLDRLTAIVPDQFEPIKL
jgi:hypothetical protein